MLALHHVACRTAHVLQVGGALLVDVPSLAPTRGMARQAPQIPPALGRQSLERPGMGLFLPSFQRAPMASAAVRAGGEEPAGSRGRQHLLLTARLPDRDILDHLFHLRILDEPVVQRDQGMDIARHPPVIVQPQIQSADVLPAEVEKAVLADETVLKWTEGKQPKKVIVVPKRIVNIVI